MAEDKTEKGQGPYAEIDGVSNPDGTLNIEGQKQFKKSEKSGDYFVRAFSMSCAIIVGIIIFIFVMENGNFFISRI